MKEVFTFLYFLSATITLVPLPWFIRKQTLNVPVAAMAFWIIHNNVFLGINSILWRGNVETKMFVYCDIGKGVARRAQDVLFLRETDRSGS